MSDQVDDLTNTLMERDHKIQEQQKTIQQLQNDIPSIKQNLNNLNSTVESNYTIVQTENKQFYVSLLALSLLALFMFIIYVYNLLLLNKILPELKKQQIFDKWVAGINGHIEYKKGGGDEDDSILARRQEWATFMETISIYL